METNEYITKQCIIEEYLNNWFTYEELAQYLCVNRHDVENILDNYCKLDEKLNRKVANHRNNINKYYETLNDDIPFITDDNKKYIEIAQHIIKTKDSVRDTAKVFGLGKTTVHEYMHNKLPKISIKHYKEVFEVLMGNKSFSINNKKIIEQVLTSYNYLAIGKTIEEIAKLQNISWHVVQRNLEKRLKLIDEEKYKIAKEILKAHQMEIMEKYRMSKNTK